MAKGFTDQFDEIYFRYHQAVYANILKIVKQQELAEEILQDVFVTFWDKQTELKSDRIPGWLFIVSFNKSMTRLKKEVSQRVVELSDDMEEVVHLDFEEDAETLYMNKLNLVHEAVETLSPSKKKVFVLAHYEHKTVHQIASEMKISIESVKDYKKQAMRSIRQYVSARATDRDSVIAYSVFLTILSGSSLS